MEQAKYKVMLLEDDQLDRKAFLRLVKQEDLPYDCIEAGSISEAHSLLDLEKFDVIIADYSLGDGTAFDVLDIVKDTPIIVVTGAGDEEIAINAWKAGAYDYLIKDLERNYLRAVPITIENAIRHKKTTEHLQLLSHAVMSTDDSVFITDMQNKIIFVNRAFCETYGYSEQEVIGKDSNILIRGSDSSGEVGTYEAFSGPEVGSYHIRKDGSEFPVSLSKSVIKNENGNETAIVGVARDISERLQIEDRIRAINLQLKRGIRVKN
jgi:PAS domain S-box-containing protein